MKTAVIAVLLSCFAASVMAQEPAAPKKWKESAELSYVQTTGNSRTSTVSGKDLYTYDWKKAGLELAAGGLAAKDKGITNAEQYYASEKVSWKLTGKDYVFERIGWDRNRFAGIKNRYDYSVGLGRDLVDLPNDKLLGEVGGGYIFEDRLHAKNLSYGSYRGHVKYIRTLSQTANASQDLEYIGNMSDHKGYRTNSETALIASISTHFSLKASYVWHYENSPAPGFKKSDTITSMAVIVNY